MKGEIDNAVNKKLGPILNKEKINDLPLQDFLQKTLDGEFSDNAEEAQEYSKNIYDEYMKNIKDEFTPAVMEIKRAIQEVMKMYIPPKTTLVDEEADTESDSEKEKLDIAEGGKPESEDEKRQKGQGLKILTPQQMITRLPILLAQLKAGNNSEKLKNEIRQLLYSLYRSKHLSKTIYNSLMNTI